MIDVPLSARELFVATNGDDSWSGTVPSPSRDGKDGPLATLQAARDQLRKIRAAGDLGPHIVNVRGGSYIIRTPLVLDAIDSGTQGRPNIWQAFAGETPVLSGAVRIEKWEPWKGNIHRGLLEEYKTVVGGVRQVLLDGKRQILARYPNFDPSEPVAGGWAFAGGHDWPMYSEKLGEDKHTLEVLDLDWRSWARPEEVEVFVFPRYNWWNNRVPVKSVDLTSHKVTLAQDCSYAIRKNDRYFFQNALEELDAPGEWYFDKSQGWLYFWAPEGKSVEDASVVVARNLLRLEKDAHDIVWRGFTMEGSNESCVLLESARNCVIEKNQIRSVGDWKGNGVLVSGGQSNLVRRNNITGVGNSAIMLTGGSLETLTPANNIASDNELSEFGVYFKQGLGVSISGVGNSAVHNHIFRGPRFGIGHKGAMHEIGFNHIHDVCLETEDTGAIYSNGRDWFTARGTQIHHNFIHDIPGFTMREGKPKTPDFAWGIYLDDSTGGADITGNIILRCGRGGVRAHGARDNHIWNNILMDSCEWQYDFHGWIKGKHFRFDHKDGIIPSYERVAGRPEWQNIRGIELHPKDFPLPNGLLMAGNRFERNIVVTSDAKAGALDVQQVPFDKNQFDHNLYWAPNGNIRTNFENVGADEGENLMPPIVGSIGQMPVGWSWRVKPQEGSAILAEEAGETLLQISGKSADSRAMVAVGPGIPLECGTSYRLRARLRATVEANVEIGMHCSVPERPFWISGNMKRFVRNEWAEYEWIIAVPAVGKFGWHDSMKDFNVRVSWMGAGGVLELADVRLRKAASKSDWESWCRTGADANSIVADPQFEDLRNFQLKKESPAWMLGFDRIPFEEIGPRPE